MVMDKNKKGINRSSISKMSLVDLASLATKVGVKDLTEIKHKLQMKVIYTMEKQGHLSI